MGTPPPRQRSSLIQIIALVVVIVVVVAVIGYYTYQSSLQPNIQATNLNFGSATTYPQTSTAQDQGRISGTGSFSYTAVYNYVAYLVFDNSISFVTSKQVTVTYSVAGSSNTQSFTVIAGAEYSIPVPLNQGQTFSGTFTVSGGSGNDVNFLIMVYSCSQTVPFSMTLVNSGNANGYATVSLQVQSGSSGGNSLGSAPFATTTEGSPPGTGILVQSGTVFSNKYYLHQNQQLPISGTATIPDCGMHTIVPVISQEQKG